MEKHERAPSRQGDRASLLEHARLLLDRTAVKREVGESMQLELDVDYLESVTLFLEAAVFHFERSAAAGHTEPCLQNPPSDPPPPLEDERCLVCGHYHGGQGSCITAHALVPARDCPTCLARAVNP